MRAEEPFDIEATKAGETRDLGDVTVAYRNQN